MILPWCYNGEAPQRLDGIALRGRLLGEREYRLLGKDHYYRIVYLVDEQANAVLILLVMPLTVGLRRH